MSKFSKRKWKKAINKGLTNMDFEVWQLINHLRENGWYYAKRT